MKLSVINLDGKAAGDVELSEASSASRHPRDIWPVTSTGNWPSAAPAPTRSRPGTRTLAPQKMYKQKGTGGARHGSRRAPQFVGGSRAFARSFATTASPCPRRSAPWPCVMRCPPRWSPVIWSSSTTSR